MTDHAILWQQICAAADVSVPARAMWLAPLRVISLSAEELVLAAETKTGADFAMFNYRHQIATAAFQVLGESPRVRVMPLPSTPPTPPVGADMTQDTKYTSISRSNTSYTISPVDSIQDLNTNTSIPRDKRSSKSEEYSESRRLLNRFISDDPVFKKALSWNMASTMLIKFCEEYGQFAVREIISKVANRSDVYFRQPGPIELQRGKLCRAIILAELVPLSKAS